MISIQLTRRPLTRGEHFLGGTKACLIVQSILCTSSKLAWMCRAASARLLPRANRAQGSLRVHGARLAVQRVPCTSSQLAWTCRDASARLLPNADRAQGSLHVQGARLAVQRVLCTSSQLAWTCKESFARSSFRENQSIDILVPKIWYHVPHP